MDCKSFDFKIFTDYYYKQITKMTARYYNQSFETQVFENTLIQLSRYENLEKLFLCLTQKPLNKIIKYYERNWTQLQTIKTIHSLL